MPSINKCFILSSLALSALTLATPHGLRNLGQPGAAAEGLLVRVPEPTPVVVPIVAARTILPRDDDGCKSPDSTPTSKAAALKASPKASHSSSSTIPPPSGGHSPSNASSSSSGMHTGEGTYYETGLGACGVTNNDGQNIVAMSKLLFDTYPGYNGVNPNQNPICGKKLTAHYQGKSVTCTIMDRCVGCAYNDLDFSPGAFNQLANPAAGRIDGVTWDYV